MTLNPPGDVLARLGQAHTWATYRLDGGLTEIRLDDMDPEHRRHVLGWLRRHAHDLYAQRLDQIAHAHRTGASTRAEFAAELALHRARHPEEWLDQQPLVQALDRLVVRRPGVGAGILRRIRGLR
jgi:hypothetical protein